MTERERIETNITSTREKINSELQKIERRREYIARWETELAALPPDKPDLSAWDQELDGLYYFELADAKRKGVINMSAKNSGVTKKQYAAYDKDKRKAGEPVARRVALEVWRSEDRLPESQIDDFTRDTVWVWVFGVIRNAIDPTACFVLERDGELAWYVPPLNMRVKITGTSWAYIPNITTEEATT